MTIKTTAKRNRIKQGSLTVDIILHVLMALLAVATVYPIVFIFSSSISDPQAVMRGDVWLYPVGVSFDAYVRIFYSSAMLRAFINSVAYTAIITFANLTVTLMCGFGLTKRGLIGKKFWSILLIIPMWFTAGLIPTFMTISALNLYGTLWSVFLPSFLSIYNIILARTFISNLPSALMEAAEIDGASVPRIFTTIVLPLSKPIIAVLGLYTALAAWNNWFSYMLYLPTHPEQHPLQYFLVRALLWGNAQSTLALDTQLDHVAMLDRIRMAAVNNQLKYAVVVVTTVPIMLVYPFVQKYFVQGVMLGSLKE